MIQLSPILVQTSSPLCDEPVNQEGNVSAQISTAEEADVSIQAIHVEKGDLSTQTSPIEDGDISTQAWESQESHTYLKLKTLQQAGQGVDLNYTPIFQTHTHMTGQDLNEFYQTVKSALPLCLNALDKPHQTCLTILLEGHHLALTLPLLMTLFSRYESVHFLLTDPTPFQANDWATIEKVISSALPQERQRGHALIHALAQQWPLPVPGVHRFKISDTPYTITMAYAAPEYMQHQWVAQVDVYIRWALGQTEAVGSPSMIDDYPTHFQLANTRFAVIAQMPQNPRYWDALHKEGTLLTETSAGCFAGVFQSHHRYPTPLPSKKVAILGAGLAGAGIALNLKERGFEITVYDPCFQPQDDKQELNLAVTHQGHTLVAMTPFLSKDDNAKSRLSRAGVLWAYRQWRHLPFWIAQGTYEVDREKGYGKALKDSVKALGFSQEWVRLASADEIAQQSQLTGFSHDGIYWPYGAQLSPEALLTYTWSDEVFHKKAQAITRIERQQDGQWHLYNQYNECVQTVAVVIIATAGDALALLKNSDLLTRQNVKNQPIETMPKVASTLHWMGGQIIKLPLTALKEKPKVAIGGQGYLLPIYQDHCVIGSTYEHGVQYPLVTPKAQETILQKQVYLPLDKASPIDKCWPAWTGARAVVQGRMPVIAPLPYASGVWLATAYGSHGLTWSSLAGEIIGSALQSEPLPIERDLLKAINLR